MDQFVTWAEEQGTPVRNPACSIAAETVTCYGTADGAIVAASAELLEDGSLAPFTAVSETATALPVESGPASSQPTSASNAIATIEGSGSDVIALPTTISELVVLDLVYETGEIPPIEITGLDSSLAKTDAALTVFEGTSRSRYLFNVEGDQVTHVQIEAEQAWTIEFLPLSVLQTWTGTTPLEGVDSTVMQYTGPAGLLDYSFEERPETWYGSDFYVLARSLDGLESQLVVDMTLGTTQGTTAIPPGPALLEVHATGSWVLAAVRAPE